MRGFVSFHPVDLVVFDEIVAPLAGGRKINPESFLQTACRVRRSAWVARRYALSLPELARNAEAPKPDASSSLWTKIRVNLEKMDFKPDDLARRAKEHLDPDLHLDGRPFFVAEASAERVADAVDAYLAAQSDAGAKAVALEQMTKLDAELGRTAEPAEIEDLSADPVYRNDLLALLRKIHDLSRRARDPGTDGVALGASRIPDAGLAAELPWLAVSVHSKVIPFWIGRDVDGLETICRAAGVEPPECLSPAWRPFAELCEAHPALRAELRLELSSPRSVGAFVAPDEIGKLLDFLNLSGAKIIGAAARADEGAAATALLRKIKECAVYAQRHGFGYLEASGILPPERDEPGDEAGS